MGGHLIILTARLRHLWPPRALPAGALFLCGPGKFHTFGGSSTCRTLPSWRLSRPPR